MAEMYFDVDTAITECPVNIMPLIDDTDFKSREVAIAYNAAGMDLVWNFCTSAGAFTQTAVTPTTAGVYDWTHQGDGMYTIEIPASGGASINNDTEGYGWFTGFVTGVLPWRGPIIGFRAAALNDSLCDTNTTGLLAPTVSARTLDVSATGEAGVDWANVGGATTSVSLTNTTVATVTTTTTATNLTTNNDKTGYALSAAGVDAIWDESLAAHQTAATAGRAATLGGIPIAETTAAGTPTTSSIQITAGSTTDGFYEDQTFIIVSGVGAGQARVISTYTGATRTCSFDEPFTTAPAAADAVIIKADHVHPVSEIQVGLATAAALATAQADLNTLTGADGVIIASGTQTFNMTGNITGNLSGSVGSVTGAVGSVTGAVGSVTGNVGGNVVGSVASVTARVTANTDQINSIATAASRLARSTQGIVTGTVGAASTTTSIVTSALDPAAAVIDQYKGRIVTFDQGTTTANLRGQSTDITANTALGVLTVTALTTAPVSGDTFTIT